MSTIHLFNKFHLGDGIFMMNYLYQIRNYLIENEMTIVYHCEPVYKLQLEEFVAGCEGHVQIAPLAETPAGAIDVWMRHSFSHFNLFPYNDFLVSLIRKEVKPGDLVVDFGAGIGTFSKQVAMAGHAVHCVEPDHRQLDRILALGLPASETIASFENESIDLLYTLNVLEHIENDLEVLEACYQKIKPGGHILIYVPAFNVLYSSMDKSVGHIRRYTRSTLAEKVRLAGFTVDRNEYVDSAGFFASLLFKIFLQSKNDNCSKN